MSLYKRPDSNVWWYQFNFEGQRVQRSSKTTNKRAAAEIEAAYRVKLAKGEAGIDTPVAAPTVTEFSKRFLEFVAVDSADKPRTVLFYQQRTKALLNSKLGRLPLDAITVQHITEYKAANLQSVATTNRNLATLRRMLSLAMEWGAITKVTKIKLSSGEGKRDYVLGEEDEGRYLAACTPLLRRVAVIMLDCGCRPEEIFRLRYENCRDGLITILKGKGEGSRRSVEMTARVAEAIGNGFGYVFASDDTKEGTITHSTLKKAHLRAVKESGVPTFVPYSLRHTCLTRWAAAGMDAPTLMYLAGHRDIRTSLAYIHLTDAQMQAKLRQIRSATTFLTTGKIVKSS